MNAKGRLKEIFDLILEQEKNENELILENLQKGFMLGDKVLRHAKVKINSSKKSTIKIRFCRNTI